MSNNMKHFLLLQIGRMRHSRVIEVPNVLFYFIARYLCNVFAMRVTPRYAIKSGCVGGNVRLVKHVFGMSHASKVGYPVVIFLLVDMINMAGRPIAICHQPSKTVRSECFSADRLS